MEQVGKNAAYTLLSNVKRKMEESTTCLHPAFVVLVQLQEVVGLEGGVEEFCTAHPLVSLQPRPYTGGGGST